MNFAGKVVAIVCTATITSCGSAPIRMAPDVAVANPAPVATLRPARDVACVASAYTSCENFDAIVFVHGIYGGEGTFVNQQTGFDWPKQFPASIQHKPIDVYRLDYKSALLSWAKGNNPGFDEVAKAVMSAMEPLRERRYRSIGFIAHSLGGNVVSTYIHMVNTTLGHPQRAENAFVITLATPVLGAQIADIADTLKSVLGMRDDLLESLKANNLYDRMLKEFREEEAQKGLRGGCRAVDLYAAYEQKFIGPILVVDKESAAGSIKTVAASPPKGFPVNHSEIAKPKGTSDPVYVWVLEDVEKEQSRLEEWDKHHDMAGDYGLCEKIPFLSLKQELTHHERFADRDEARSKVFEYIEVFYNRQRLHSGLDYRSPDQFEKLTVA